MRKFRIPYIPYRSLLLSTTVLNDIERHTGMCINGKKLHTQSVLKILPKMYSGIPLLAIIMLHNIPLEDDQTF